MTSQKTIEKCRAKVAELEKTNATLLHNNLVLSEENKKLRDENIRKDIVITETNRQRQECKTKCEIAISEKDRLLRAQQARLENCKPTYVHLKNAQWFYRLNQLPDGQIEIIHTVKFP